MSRTDHGGGPLLATTSRMRVCRALGQVGFKTRGGIGPLTTSVMLSSVGGSTGTFTFGASTQFDLAVVGRCNRLSVGAGHSGQGRLEQLLEFPVRLAVVLPAALNRVVGNAAAVHLGDLDHAAGLAGYLLVGQEVVAQPVEQGRRALINVGPVAVRRVALEHGDDLVVGLVVVDHAQPADRYCPKQNIAVTDRAL